MARLLAILIVALIVGQALTAASAPVAGLGVLLTCLAVGFIAGRYSNRVSDQ